MKFVAFIVKGLEDICREELTLIDGVQILSKDSKFIIFEYTGNIETLQQLRTVDDVAIVINEIQAKELSNYRLNFKEIQSHFIPVISKFRDLNNTFSITTSLYKAKGISQDDLKKQFSQQILENLKLTYTQFDHTNLDFRINIDHDRYIISLKLFAESLFKRNYGHITDLGSIRSTIASAMLFKLLKHHNSLKKSSNLKLVDNFCGSGTFLCEAYLLGLNIFGSDLQKYKVGLAEENLSKIGYKKQVIKVQDARQTEWESKYFDIAVANFPWNKQVSESNLSELYKFSIKEYFRILKPDGVIGLIGVKPDLIRKYLRAFFVNYQLEEIKIGYQGQTPTILIAYPQTT